MSCRLLAAREAGVKKVFIPKDNIQKVFDTIDIEIIPVEDIDEVISTLFDKEIIEKANEILHA